MPSLLPLSPTACIYLATSVTEETFCTVTQMPRSLRSWSSETWGKCRHLRDTLCKYILLHKSSRNIVPLWLEADTVSGSAKAMDICEGTCIPEKTKARCLSGSRVQSSAVSILDLNSRGKWQVLFIAPACETHMFCLFLCLLHLCLNTPARYWHCPLLTLKAREEHKWWSLSIVCATMPLLIWGSVW